MVALGSVARGLTWELFSSAFVSLVLCSTAFTCVVSCSEVSNCHSAHVQVSRRMWAVLLHCMRMRPACAQLRGCTHGAMRLPLDCVLICYSAVGSLP